MNDDNSGDAREMLDLIDGQQRRVDRGLRLPVVWLYSIWAFAWLVGFLALYLAVLGVFDPVAAGIVFAVLIVASIVASAVIGSRIGRGLRGQSQFAGTVYGISWSVCSIAFALLGIGLLAQGMPDDLAGIYFPSAYAMMCGTLYLGGAALWHDTVQLVLGLALLVVGAVVPFLGLGPNLLVLAIAAAVIFGSGAVVTARSLRG
ncbi:hypothetical protein [Leifsonia naganoensis]|uniref:Putative membrane protein YiaA n=1 Tax=Leifsonia naganoensis TaxID=150025 RepID=A0A853DTV8_9MICO|nr:hypothetical protein [Leifsonia naganoensis]NYK11103.1 putative membrane protein YiaA [Leifsonia naganoensis]